jgi:flagellar biosynthesis protein FlhF
VPDYTVGDESAKTLSFVGATVADAVTTAQLSLGREVEVVEQRCAVELVAAPTGDDSAVRCFVASSSGDAILQAKMAFGGDAVFLEQREVMEVVVRPEAPRMQAPRSNPLLQKTYGMSPASLDPMADLPAPLPTLPSPSSVSASAPSASFGKESVLDEIQNKLDDLYRLARQTDRPAVPESLNDLYMTMVDNQVSEELARHLVETLSDQLPAEVVRNREAVRQAMIEAIARLIPVDGGIQLHPGEGPTVIVVVGATGVGKTTSIAKLAMQLKIHRQCRVGLITEDTSRPGGTEQLRAVAQLLNIPLVVADTVDRIRQAVGRSGDRDVILIDTAGRVPRNRESLQELSRFIEAIGPDEVHLAVSSVSASRHALKLIEEFDCIKFDHIIFTKMDEACDYGLILNVASHVDRGISYVTTGQDYMENIELGDAQRLAALVLEGESSLSGTAASVV